LNGLSQITFWDHIDGFMKNNSIWFGSVDESFSGLNINLRMLSVQTSEDETFDISAFSFEFENLFDHLLSFWVCVVKAIIMISNHYAYLKIWASV